MREPADIGRRLSEVEREQYTAQGYVKNLPVLDQEGVADLQRRFMDLLDQVPPAVDIYRVNNWHKANRWVYELSQTPAILDYVEEILGANFNLWAGGLAHENLPAAPDWNRMSPEDRTKSKFVLWQQVDPESYDDDQIVDLDLQAGEVSLHDDDLIHGSSANNSADRVWAGITFRYIPTEVKCDLGVWPNVEVYPCRGVDVLQHNPIGKIPTENGNPTSFNQLSSDFK